MGWGQRTQVAHVSHQPAPRPHHLHPDPAAPNSRTVCKEPRQQQALHLVSSRSGATRQSPTPGVVIRRRAVSSPLALRPKERVRESVVRKASASPSVLGIQGCPLSGASWLVRWDTQTHCLPPSPLFFLSSPLWAELRPLTSTSQRKGIEGPPSPVSHPRPQPPSDGAANHLQRCALPVAALQHPKWLFVSSGADGNG